MSKYELIERLGLKVRSHSNYDEADNVSARELEALLRENLRDNIHDAHQSIVLSLKPADHRVSRSEIRQFIPDEQGRANGDERLALELIKKIAYYGLKD